MAADNKLLGQFDLVGIPPAPRGMPQVEVTFDIDANGIVQVSARDKGTGKEQQIRIQASGGLSDNDIKRMVKEAEEHAADDKAKKELIEARNHADSLAHQTEKQLKEHGEKIPAADKGQIESDIAALRAVMTGDDVKAIRDKTQVLMQSSMKLGEAMYRAASSEAAGPGPGGDAGPGAGGAAPSGDKPNDAKVVDAEFEEVDETKKGKRA
jgi:molecular chaperone DnaK